jgi:hypothetical protein
MPIEQLITFIEGTAQPSALIESESFVRGQDIVDAYLASCAKDKLLLAYTNHRVQELNAIANDYKPARSGDTLFSPTTRHSYTLHETVHPGYVTSIELPYGEPLVLNSKYKTLEHLVKMEGVDFYEVSDTTDEALTITVAAIFGHGDYRDRLSKLKAAAAASNKAIEDTAHMSAAGWAKQNSRHKLARARAKAWRDFLTFNDCVICLDFPFAMTVHKSQGSTVDEVFLDTENLGICANTDYQLYLKLMYVGMSRARFRVITN